jgi:hypothetical protein
VTDGKPLYTEDDGTERYGGALPPRLSPFIERERGRMTGELILEAASVAQRDPAATQVTAEDVRRAVEIVHLRYAADILTARKNDRLLRVPLWKRVLWNLASGSTDIDVAMRVLRREIEAS